MRTIVHLSDFHTTQDWNENQGVVFNKLTEDLQSKLVDPKNTDIIITGDIVRSGQNRQEYEIFNNEIINKIQSIGIEKHNIYICPGNHDVDSHHTEKHKSILHPIMAWSENERIFNDNMNSGSKELICQKFNNFIENTPYNTIKKEQITGQGHSNGNNIGIYTLNTAIFSFGSVKDQQNKSIKEFEQLPVGTRTLNKWAENNKDKYRILAMHHPINWLKDWARIELERVIKDKFNLVLCGHTHAPKSLNEYDGTNSAITCIAPALFTNKHRDLGYSIINVFPEIKTEITYRQWTGERFVLGTTMSGTESGVITYNHISHRQAAPLKTNNGPQYCAIENSLKVKFEESLEYHKSLPNLWVTPNLSDQPENAYICKEATQLSGEDFYKNLKNCIIKSPPQFGLTAFGRYVALKKWQETKQDYIAFFSAEDLKNHVSAIEKSISEHLKQNDLDEKSLKGIIIDVHNEINPRQINNIRSLYPDCAIIILARINDTSRISNKVNHELNEQFPEYYLWSLDRTQVRSLVCKFIESGYDFNEDEATQRLADDLENLNLHRTPLNCSILLAVYQQQIDSKPTNRTEMLEKFLYIIFNNYKTRNDYSNLPDMKDCLYILGAFSQEIICNTKGPFTRRDFILFANKYCDDMAIDIEYEKIFEILLAENIFVERSDGCFFRYYYWLYFFAAHRMHHSPDFRNYIISNSRYTSFPEIIEFYTGIDRRREEIIDTLIEDISRLNNSCEERTKIGRKFDPYTFAKWDPSDNDIERIKQNIDNEINQSNIPKAQKDAIADNSYDRSKPYLQQINNFVNDSSLLEGIQVMRCAARALRNSDYVDPQKKKSLLDQILRTWIKPIQLLTILSPILAQHRRVEFERLSYELDNSFDQFESQEELWMEIFASIANNIVTHHEKDFASARMTTLLKKKIMASNHELEAHILVCNLIRQRPANWFKIVKIYIEKLNKTSFYIYLSFQEARREFMYGFCDTKQKNELSEILALCLAKHQLKKMSPNKKEIKEAKSNFLESDDTK